MKTVHIIGWKTYAVGVLAIIIGMIAWWLGFVGDGLKGIIGGCALIALRDAVGKVLRGQEELRLALTNLRAAIDTHWNKNTSRG
jgi:hypothetical protein